MKGKRHSEEQIIGLLNRHETGAPMKELIREVGITEQTFYRRRAPLVCSRGTNPR